MDYLEIMKHFREALYQTTLSELDFDFRLGPIQPIDKIELAEKHNYGIVAGFKGNVNGLILISLSNKMAMTISSKLLGNTHSSTKITKERKDCLKEFLNLIIGAVSLTLDKKHISIINTPITLIENRKVKFFLSNSTKYHVSFYTNKASMFITAAFVQEQIDNE